MGRSITTDGELDTQAWSLEERGRWYWACQQLLHLVDGVEHVAVVETMPAAALRFSPWAGTDATAAWLEGLGFQASIEAQGLTLRRVAES